MTATTHPAAASENGPRDRAANKPASAAQGHSATSAKILVTGATGLIGRNFARRAAAAGYSVLAMVRRNSDRSALDGVAVQFVEGDLAQPETLPGALADADVVVHTAAHLGDWGPPEKYRAINVVALDHMLNAVVRRGQLQRWIQLSSQGVYPARHHYGTDETTPPETNNIDGYTQTKAESELVVHRYIREHNLPAVIIRPGFTYGPGERNALKRVVEKIEAGKMKIIGRGDRVVNNTSVHNLCDAILLAIQTPNINGETFNIRDERLVTREEFVHTICDYLGKPHPRHVPERLVKGLVGPIEAIARLIGTESPPIITRGQIKFLTQNLDYSIAKAKRMLGYRPRVDFRDGIIEALDYLTGKPIVRELATS